MPKIMSVGEAVPSHFLDQNRAMEFSKELFSQSFHNIERLLNAFQNGQIQKRHFVKNIDWYKQDHSFTEKNNEFISAAIELGTCAIKKCLHNEDFLKKEVPCEEIDAFIMVTSTGLATPSIDARIMNILPFSEKTKRIPIWGLGCAGGAAGLSRAFEYCLAFPKAKVLVLTVELCSLTFQSHDHSKSNLIGTSLFADGAACVLIAGDEADVGLISNLTAVPTIVATQSTLMQNSLDVMGWEIKDGGLNVIFSKDIPTIVEKWLKPNVAQFLDQYQLSMEGISYFIAHPGGKKVLEAYVKSLNLSPSEVELPLEVLKDYGNMSSATVLFVLKRFMQKGEQDKWGLCTALGPGFSSELLLLRWEKTCMTSFYLFYVLIVFQRLSELAIAKRNEKWMKKEGAREFGQGHYHLIVLVHTMFFIAFLLEVLNRQTGLSPAWPVILSLFCLTQFVRAWSLLSLGRYWNTKIIVLPGAAIIKKGPYRFLKHPNYLVVSLEFILIPILFQAYMTAIIFTLLNGMILSIRVPAEEKALALIYKTE